jgi:hypothetical protein
MAVAKLSWLILAAIHAFPAAALLRPALLARLYGVELGSTSAILLQHRAGLFAAILTVCIWAAFVPGVRQLAAVVVALSMISFLILYFGGGSPPALRVIAIADLIGLPFLAYAAWDAFSRR